TVVVVGGEGEIIDVLGGEYRDDHTYMNHYTVRDCFSDYLTEAKAALELYRTRARLVITTFLHCALPCIAMGIPVIAFLPRPQYDFQKTSDEERFSGLTQIAPVHRFGDTSDVDWSPRPIDVERIKEAIARDFHNRIAAALAAAR